jgi:hypothetical protein
VVKTSWVNHAGWAPTHKRGDLLECANYRGISLLNTAYKVLSNIIYAHLLPYTEAKIGSYQYGFQPGKSTTGCPIHHTTDFRVGA